MGLIFVRYSNGSAIWIPTEFESPLYWGKFWTYPLVWRCQFWMFPCSTSFLDSFGQRCWTAVLAADRSCRIHSELSLTSGPAAELPCHCHQADLPDRLCERQDCFVSENKIFMFTKRADLQVDWSHWRQVVY